MFKVTAVDAPPTATIAEDLQVEAITSGSARAAKEYANDASTVIEER